MQSVLLITLGLFIFFSQHRKAIVKAYSVSNCPAESEKAVYGIPNEIAGPLMSIALIVIGLIVRYVDKKCLSDNSSKLRCAIMVIVWILFFVLALIVLFHLFYFVLNFFGRLICYYGK